MTSPAPFLPVLDWSDADPFAVVFGRGRGSARPPGTQPRDRTGVTYASVEEFYAADPEGRKFAPEVDFGVGWRGPDRSRWPNWCVHYSGVIGEVFAVRTGQPDTVIVLGVITPDCDALAPPSRAKGSYYATLDLVLGDKDQSDGWHVHMAHADGLAWVSSRLAAHNAKH